MLSYRRIVVYWQLCLSFSLAAAVPVNQVRRMRLRFQTQTFRYPTTQGHHRFATRTLRNLNFVTSPLRRARVLCRHRSNRGLTIAIGVVARERARFRSYEATRGTDWNQPTQRRG